MLDVGELLRQAVGNDIIDLNDVQAKLEMKKKSEILEKHPYAISQGRDGKWRTYLVDYTKKNNRRQIKKSTREKIEEAIINEYKQKEKKKELTLEKLYPEWLKYYRLHTNSDGTVKRITSDWNKFYLKDVIIKKPIKKLTKVELDEWVHEKIKTYHMTKTCYYNMSLIIRKMMAYARECEYIEKNVFAEVKVNSKMFVKKQKNNNEEQVYTLEEEMKLVEEAWKDYSNNPEITTPLAVVLIFYLGLRVGEVVALKESDIKGDKIVISRMESRLFKTGNGTDFVQTGREVVEHTKSSAGNREIYLVPEAREVLRVVLEQNRMNKNQNNEYLFVVDGKRIYDTAVRWRVEKYCKKTGIPYRSPHKIRKTWISKLIDEGLNINTIRELSGHEDERTTYKNYCYDRKTEKQRQEQLEKALILKRQSGIIENKLVVCL